MRRNPLAEARVVPALLRGSTVSPPRLNLPSIPGGYPPSERTIGCWLRTPRRPIRPRRPRPRQRSRVAPPDDVRRATVARRGDTMHDPWTRRLVACALAAALGIVVV